MLRFVSHRNFLVAAFLLGCLSFSTLPGYTSATTTATTTDSDIESDAESATSTINTIIESITTERSPSIEQNREQLQQVRTDAPILTERTQQRFLNLGANASNRMEATIARLEQISERLARRIQQEAEVNRDTTSAERALDAANLALEAAAVSIAEIDTNMHTFVFSQNPRESWVFTQALYTATQQSIIDAHTALRISINELAQAQIIQPEVISE